MYTAIILFEIVVIIVAIVVLVYVIGLIKAATQWLKNDDDRKEKMFSFDYQMKNMDLKDRTIKEQSSDTVHQSQRTQHTQNTQEKDYVFCPMCGERNSKENECCQNCGYQLK